MEAKLNTVFYILVIINLLFISVMTVLFIISQHDLYSTAKELLKGQQSIVSFTQWFQTSSETDKP